MANLPRVALIITGGTIDSLGKDRLDLAWYIEAGKRLGDGELLQQLPELKSIAEVQEVPFRRLPSHALVDKDWLDLVRTIHSIFDQDKADGIVITHGTDTLEETAFFLNLVIHTDKPIVLVGSMRPGTAMSADGMLNLYDADGKIQFDKDREAARQYFLQHVNQNTVFFHDLDEKLDAVIAQLPAMKRPTVAKLYGSEDYEISTVADKSTVNVLIPALKSAGAEDILEMPISKIVR